MRPYVFSGGTAVVTGAGSGIGEALTHALAARGSHLVLVDQHADRLTGSPSRSGPRTRASTSRRSSPTWPTTTPRSTWGRGSRPSTLRRRCW